MNRDPQIYLDPAEWRCSNSAGDPVVCARRMTCVRRLAALDKGSKLADGMAQAAMNDPNPWNQKFGHPPPDCEGYIPIGTTARPPVATPKPVHHPIHGI